MIDDKERKQSWISIGSMNEDFSLKALVISNSSVKIYLVPALTRFTTTNKNFDST